MNRLPAGRIAPPLAHSTALAGLLLLLISPACSLAQLPDILAPAQELVPAEEQAPASRLPNFAGRTVPGEAAVDLADFISGCLVDSGALPDFMQVQTADGSLRRISAAEAFILLARTAYLWETMGALPATIPIAPDQVSAPLIDPEDVPPSGVDPDAGRDIPTDQFLAQCGDTVRWVDRLHTVPTAIWVDGHRLSAAEYLAGLAICIQYAYWEGGLYDTIYLPLYSPPQSWTGFRVDRAAEAPPTTPLEEAQAGTEAPYEEASWQEPYQEESPPALPLTTFQPESPLARAPQLTLFPASGSTLSGKVDLVAGYLGPPARFVIFAIDGATRAIMNSPPYSCGWDTSGLVPGPHIVRVQVLGAEGAVLVDQLCGYTIAPPEPRLTEEELLDDL